jgi:hypothetical protein
MIRNKQELAEMVIDLTGPQGNAYFLMGYARKLATQIGIDPKPILDEMMSGDYENLIRVFDENFGSFVILER